MQTLVFSDTHFSKKFNKRQFNALVKQISYADRVVINGDFWEALDITFDDFINSEWNKLFPFLKQKQTVYVYGNHDDPYFSDDRVYQFCDRAVKEYLLETPSNKYLFRHGHQFLFPKHTDECLIKSLKQARTFQRRLRLKVAGIIQQLGFGVFGPKILPSFINHISTKTRNGVGKPGHLLVCVIHIDPTTIRRKI